MLNYVLLVYKDFLFGLEARVHSYERISSCHIIFTTHVVWLRLALCRSIDISSIRFVFFDIFFKKESMIYLVTKKQVIRAGFLSFCCYFVFLIGLRVVSRRHRWRPRRWGPCTRWSRRFLALLRPASRSASEQQCCTGRR
jgi:hypothetical protein